MDKSAIEETLRGTIASLDVQLHEALKERDQLKERLEISDEHDIDGIEARDATIRLQDEQLRKLKAKLEEAEKMVEVSIKLEKEVYSYMEFNKLPDTIMGLCCDFMKTLANYKDRQ